MHFCPYQDPQVGVLRSWANALHLTSPQPINDRFVVIMNSCRTDSFLEKTPEGRLLRSFGGALHHELGTQRSVHPVHRPHLVLIELHQLPPTRTTSTPNTPKQRAIGGDVVSEAFSCHSPALYFSNSHLWTVKWPFPPVTSTQRVRLDSFLPPPTFLRCLGLLFPFSQPFWDLVCDFPP